LREFEQEFGRTPIALAALLTICLTMAWRLLIFLRPPFSATITV